MLKAVSLEDILDLAGVDLEDEANATIKTVIDGITGANRYTILQVLLNYFNHYEVEGKLIEYLSFDEHTFDYETYTTDSTLTARKVRRAIKKLDQAILAIIPDLLPMLEEVEFLKGALASVKDETNGYAGVTLKQVVEAILTDLAFNDDTMSMLIGMIVGLLGGEDVAGLLTTLNPILDDLLDVSLDPLAVAAGAGADSALYRFIMTAVAGTEADRSTVTYDEDGLPVATVRDATWTDIAGYYSDYTYYYITSEEVEVAATETAPATTKTVYTINTYFDNAEYNNGQIVDITVDGVELKNTTLYNLAIATDKDGNIIWENETNHVPEFAREVKDEKFGYDWTYTVEATDDAEEKTYSGTVYLEEDDATEAEVEVDGKKVTVDVEIAYVEAGTKVLGANDFDWGIDSKTTFEDKKDAFITTLYGVIKAVEPVINFLFHGDDIAIKNKNGDEVISIKGGEGYRYAIYPLLQGLAVDNLVSTDAYASGKNTELTLTAITDGVFDIVDNLVNGPLEYVLTLLPSLSYFLASNGVELFIRNLVSPVFALLEVAEPAVGALLDDLLGGLLSPLVADFMPEDLGKTVETTL